MLIERGGPHASAFMRDLLRQLKRARVSGLDARMLLVRFGGVFSRGRPFVAARLDHLADVSCYVGARGTGSHLEVLTLAAVEPNLLKRTVAGILYEREWWAWSMPRGIEREEEFKSFATLVETETEAAARRLSMRLSTAGGELAGEGGSALDRWQ